MFNNSFKNFIASLLLLTKMYGLLNVSKFYCEMNTDTGFNSISYSDKIRYFKNYFYLLNY